MCYLSGVFFHTFGVLVFSESMCFPIENNGFFQNNNTGVSLKDQNGLGGKSRGMKAVMINKIGEGCACKVFNIKGIFSLKVAEFKLCHADIGIGES